MQIKTLYWYEREDGSITSSIFKPNCYYEIGYRIVADAGKWVTQNGYDKYRCVDVENTYGWYEVLDDETRRVINYEI